MAKETRNSLVRLIEVPSLQCSIIGTGYKCLIIISYKNAGDEFGVALKAGCLHALFHVPHYDRTIGVTAEQF